MADKFLYADFSLNYTMQNEIIDKLLKKLDNITLKETLDDIVYRKIFVKFIQKHHLDEEEIESLNILSRYILCHKILLDQETFDDIEVYQKLLNLCPTQIWQQKIRNLVHQDFRDINFTYVIEKLKWESIIELICHDDYKKYLMAIKRKSKILGTIVRNSCDVYYF